MLAQCGLEDKVQEIHIALWRETKYVLLRFGREGRMRMNQMKGVVQQLQDKFQVVSNEILGYEAITGNAKNDDDDEGGGGIKEHPGFKHIVDEIKLKKGTVRSWMKGDDDEKEEEEQSVAPQQQQLPQKKMKKRGRCFLQRVVGKDDVERMPRRVLMQKVLEMEAKLVEAENMREMFDALSNQLSQVERENSMLLLQLAIDNNNNSNSSYGGGGSNNNNAVVVVAGAAAAGRQIE